MDAPLPDGRYDLVFARWVFLFLPEPLAHLKKLAKALKPGGRIAIQDYHRESMRLYPTPPDWDALVAADVAFFQTQGGDASIGGKLSELYKKAGLAPESAKAELKTGFPGSDVWTWASWYFLGVMPRLGKIKPFSPAAARRMSAAWKAAAKRPESLFVAPAVLDCVARKAR
jgi:SAM-dependent methyltransferase